MRSSTFRSFLRVEDDMMRAAMPKTSAADPKPMRGFPVVVKSASPKPLVPLTATIAQRVAVKGAK